MIFQKSDNIVNPEMKRFEPATIRTIFILISLFIIVFAIYSNSFSVPFHFDDYGVIVENENLYLEKLNLKNAVKTFYSSPMNPDYLYRPLVSFSFAINYYFHKHHVFGYHLVNVTVHWITAFFLFLFIRNMLKLPLVKDQYTNHAFFLAAVSAIFWATSPVQTQAVTYIVQRMASMSAMFYIMSMFFFLKARSSHTPLLKYPFYLACIVTGFFAIASKENAVMLPFSLLLLEGWFIRGIDRINIRKTLFFLFIGAGITAFFIWVASEGNPFSLLSGYENRPFTLWERLLTETRVILFYISLLLLPLPGRLNIAQQIAISRSLFNPLSTIVSLILILAIIVYAFYLAKKRPVISFCTLFFFLNLAVESTVLPLELIYDHRCYLPSMFFYLPFVILFFHLLLSVHNKIYIQIPLFALMIFVIIALGKGTYSRNQIWQSEKSLWSDAARKSPDLSRPHINLAKIYYNEGNIKKGVSENLKAIRLNRYSHNSHRILPHSNLGEIFLQLNMIDEAIAHYNAIVELNPDISNAYNQLAIAFLKKGKLVTAEKNARKAIELDDENAHAYNNLGRILMEMGNFKKAYPILQNAYAIEPELADASYNLGIYYLVHHKYQNALHLFKTIIKNEPNPMASIHIKAVLGIIEAHHFLDNQNRMKAASTQFIRQRNHQVIKNTIDRMKQAKSDPAAKIFLDVNVILKSIGEAFFREAEYYYKQGEYCLKTVKEINTLHDNKSIAP